ncbi:Pycsar system effector family protein [Curtobacterium sp. VKM Ac-1393]|uniref:Pycsar system effector family protein n=1 Tax=Curtobacterium sp. VKM Ac-1393 TaxID=2783814 RepID=UPI00188CCF8A|nr:Pycsar system effector family protein [Curtobacterium sp. VKM Ac-1393]MBF4606537.1 hypothetical protein [Curtobacterium sp. VKM Ac-1393]
MSKKKSERLEGAAWQQLELVNGWIRHSDAKLTALLALVGIAGGGVYAVAQNACGRPSILATAAVAGALLASAAICVVLGLIPRRRFLASDQAEVVFYRAVASLYPAPTDYAAAFAAAQARGELSANLLRQVAINAAIADRKFVLTIWSTVLLALALAALVTGATMSVLA